MSMGRRNFLKTAAAGGLVAAAASTPLGGMVVWAAPKTFAPNVWLSIDPDGIVTVQVNKAEMGQGVSTSLPAIVAEELSADFAKVRFAFAPAGPAFVDPGFKMQLTGGSTAVRNMYEPLRLAGAAAREMLVNAAAKSWGVKPAECSVEASFVKHPSGKSAEFGTLVALAAKEPVPAKPTLKDPKTYTILGKDLKRLDLVDKTAGKTVFGLDVDFPGLKVAVVAKAPVYGATPIVWREDKALAVHGVMDVVEITSGVAVVASNTYAAIKGREALDIAFSSGEFPDLDDASLAEDYAGALDKPGLLAQRVGNPEAAGMRSDRKVIADYSTPYVAHAAIEPMNATVWVKGDLVECWTPTQFQTLTLKTLSGICGVPEERVTVHSTFLGGGFGRKAEVDCLRDAAEISKKIGGPVQVLYTRDDDFKHDFYRPASKVRFEGSVKGKRIESLKAKIVMDGPLARLFPGALKDGVDPSAVEGIAENLYDIPNLEVRWVPFGGPIPVGFWRSVGHSQNCFAREAFIDELAVLVGEEPLAFRISHLSKAPRAVGVLKAAAEGLDWNAHAREGYGKGIAWDFSYGSFAACAAEVRLDDRVGELYVSKLSCAIDCGVAFDKRQVTQQVQGAAIMGLSTALFERMHFAQGGPATSFYTEYGLASAADTPEITVAIIQSGEALGGVGEPGLPPVPAAIANAISALTGRRMRDLPITPAMIGAKS